MTNELKEKIETEHQKFRAQLTTYIRMAKEANQGIETLRGIIAPFKIIIQNKSDDIVKCVTAVSLRFNESYTLVLQHPSQDSLEWVLFSFFVRISLGEESFYIARIEYKTFMKLLHSRAEEIGEGMAILELGASDAYGN